MANKTKGIIQDATFQTATFQDEPINCEFAPINFLYGQNGTGKSTIANTLIDPSSHRKMSPVFSDVSFDILLFNQDYILENMTAVKNENGLGAVFLLDAANQVMK